MSSDQMQLQNSAIYQKSLEIFKLSRHIAAYVTNDKKLQSMASSDSTSDRFANNLIMDSLSLIPKVAETEIQQHPGRKLRYANSLRVFIDRLYSNCVLLERSDIQGLDFVRLLRRELKKFRKIHRNYINSIV